MVALCKQPCTNENLGVSNLLYECKQVQWNFYKLKDTLGRIILLIRERLSSFRGKPLYRLVRWKVSFIQRCPLFTVSFIRGSNCPEGILHDEVSFVISHNHKIKREGRHIHVHVPSAATA